MELILKDLTKSYGGIPALSQVSYTFTSGIYGILGANGAGKSTMLKLISDNLKRDSGEILYDGKDIRQPEFRRILGYMPQEQGYYPTMTVRNFMQYMAMLKCIPRRDRQIDSILEATNLTQFSAKQMRSCSGGTRQRVLLAQALLGDPQVLILDEPTAGLDPEERIRIRNLISAFSKNRIVLLATHIVEDIALISDQILLMRGGTLLGSDTPDGWLQSIAPFVAEVEDPETLQQNFQVSNVHYVGGRTIVRIVGENAASIPGAVLCSPSLEDVYLYYLGSGAEEIRKPSTST